MQPAMTHVEKRPIAAAIDIGSNSIKMTIARLDSSGGIEQIGWASDVVRLGQGMDETGRIAADRLEAAIETLSRFAGQARQLGASRLLAVATEATRAAENGGEFLDRVERETGIEVQVVNGLEEAALTFKGLSATTDLSGQVVVADIGGGSTELIVSKDGVMQSARSIPLGSGRLTDRFVRSDPPLTAELATSEAEADAVIQGATKAESLPHGDGTRLIIVGGTGEFLARMVPDEQAIDTHAVRTALGKMQVLTTAELADAIDAPEERARVLPAGVTVVAALASRVQPERVEIARAGIRAGLLVDALAPARSLTNAEPPKSSPSRRNRPQSGRATRRTNGHEDFAVPEAGFRDTMKKLIATRWRDVWESVPAALEGSDIEGVHDVRVASRRLRAAMDIAAPVFPHRWFTSLHREAKQITSALGEVRDRDVLLEALHADRAKAPLTEHPGIDRLIDRVERERLVAREAMERYLSTLMEGSVAREVERRFGAQAAPRANTSLTKGGQA
jgi:hypothetical protein